MSYFTNKLRILGVIILLLGIPTSVYLVLHETSFLGLAGGIQARLVIDASASYVRPNYVWRNLAQGGEANANQEQMLNSVIDTVKQLQPEYIRIDHIYDYYDVVSRDTTGGLRFNWAKLDQTVDDILETGAKPFLSLSYTPSVLTAGSEIDAPTNWEEWQLVVQRTIEHFSGVKSIRGREIPDIYYEVWNEPDLFGKWKAEGSKNYFDLYYHSNMGARKAQDVLRFKIGGPATTALYENWFGKFLEFVSDKTLRLDFYSWHRYGRDIDMFEKDIESAKKWLARDEVALRFKDIELIITEMGLDSEVNQLHDTKESAIHSLASIAVLDGKVNRAFSFEVKDGVGPTQYWGRWGLLTHEKFGKPVEKPRYKALQFLNSMQGARINVAGQGSWVKAFASSDKGDLAVLVVNYDPNGKHGESVPITFLNIRPGSYTFKRTDFLGGTTNKQITASQNTWATFEYFPANSAAIFELIPVR